MTVGARRRTPATDDAARHTVDTSVLVAALVSWHPSHEAARQALDKVDAVPAHVILETFSVLTRLPAPHRVAPADAWAVLAALSLTPLTVSGQAHVEVVRRFAAGGSVEVPFMAASSPR